MSDSMKPNGDAMAEDPAVRGGAATNYHPEPDGETKIPMDDSARDSSMVQFIPKGNDSYSSELEGKKSDEFVGLRKEELAKFANDPYWIRLRIILLVTFIITWLGMLVAAIVIIALAPRCPPRPHQEWYEKAVIYQLQPNSFQDTDQNGYGDMKGILSRIKYLRDVVEVTAVLLGPMYPSPYSRFGYDIKNHNRTCPHHYGTMTDFKDLRVALHKADIKVILDFIPNHTSAKHQWFLKSSNSSSADFNEYKDYYVWSSGRTNGNTNRPDPPNQWQSVNGGSAWEWNEDRSQYYYHTYSSDEPDLNLRNENVVRKLQQSLSFWLDEKVDGFRVLGAQYLVEPEDLTMDLDIQPESYQLIASWRQLLNNYSESEGKSKTRYKSRVLIADVNGTTSEVVQFTGYMDNDVWVPGAHIASNKALVSLNQACLSAACIFSLVSNWTTGLGNATSNWQVGNAFVSRVATRVNNVKYVNAINMLLLTLDGIALTFYGDELGLTDVEYNTTAADGKVKEQRGWLTPMQWNNSENAGFTRPSVEPYVPVASNFHETNVQTQQAHGSGVTHLGLFHELVRLRRASESLQWGALQGLAVQSSVLLYVREADGFNPFLVAINFGPSPSTVDFEAYQREHLGSVRLPLHMNIVTSTFNFEGPGRDKLFLNGTVVDRNKMIHLRPTEGVVLSWQPSAPVNVE